MKGKYLNQERASFLEIIRKLLDDAQWKLVCAENYRERFDAYDEYREDYCQEYITKIAQAKAGLMKVIEILDE